METLHEQLGVQFTVEFMGGLPLCEFIREFATVFLGALARCLCFALALL